MCPQILLCHASFLPKPSPLLAYSRICGLPFSCEATLRGPPPIILSEDSKMVRVRPGAGSKYWRQYDYIGLYPDSRQILLEKREIRNISPGEIRRVSRKPKDIMPPMIPTLLQRLVAGYMKKRQTHREFSTSCASLNLRQVLESCPRRERMLKVTVLGAGGCVGEPLSMMLKQSPLIDELSLYDVCNISGMGLDISHMDTKCKVCTFVGEEELDAALTNARIVVMAAGDHYRKDIPPKQHFCQNAQVVATLSEACRRSCPEALIAVITTPINCMVPIVSELFLGQDHRIRVFGVMGAEVLTANTLLAEVTGLDPEDLNVPVIGGSSSDTAVPVFSQTRPKVDIPLDEMQRMIRHVQTHSADMQNKDPPYSNHLSMAFGTARFIISLCKGLCGQPRVVECAYIRSKILDGCPYLASEVELGPAGVTRNWGIPKLLSYEDKVLARALGVLRSDIMRSMTFLHGEDATLPEIKQHDTYCNVTQLQKLCPPK